MGRCEDSELGTETHPSLAPPNYGQGGVKCLRTRALLGRGSVKRGSGIVNLKKGQRVGLDCVLGHCRRDPALTTVVFSSALALLILVLLLMTPWTPLLQDARAVYPWGVGLPGAHSEDGTPSVHSSARDGSEYIPETGQDGDEKRFKVSVLPQTSSRGCWGPMAALPRGSGPSTHVFLLAEP